MKLFEMKNWNLSVSEEAWGISAFKKLLDRDKTKDKQVAMKEMLFIYFYCDIKSDYNYITEDDIKSSEIKKDIMLPKKWELDKHIQAAIDVYRERSQSVIEKLYMQSLKSAQDIGNYLEGTDVLLRERDNNGKPVTDINKITGSVKLIPTLMKDLKSAYKEVVKEQQEMDGRKKGSRTMGAFEDGV